MKYAADHALQVAIEMERLGKTFYESLAAGCGHAGIEVLATTLAKDEGKHIEIFTRLRDALPPDQRGPKVPEKELFSAAKELSKKIIPSAGEVHDAVLLSSLHKALDMAIEMESDAVAYYSGLASGTAGLDAAVLTSIADEEKSHLRALVERRQRLFDPVPVHQPESAG
jgi:rubrerythrin